MLVDTIPTRYTNDLLVQTWNTRRRILLLVVAVSLFIRLSYDFTVRHHSSRKVAIWNHCPSVLHFSTEITKFVHTLNTKDVRNIKFYFFR
jgi:hypothetical protein